MRDGDIDYFKMKEFEQKLKVIYELCREKKISNKELIAWVCELNDEYEITDAEFNIFYMAHRHRHIKGQVFGLRMTNGGR